MRARVRWPTHDLSQQHHILSPHDEDSSRDVSELLSHVDPLDRLVEHQVGWRTKGGRGVTNPAPRLRDDGMASQQSAYTELVDAPQVPDQRSAVSQQHQVLL